jgi:hypothetical protein
MSFTLRIHDDMRGGFTWTPPEFELYISSLLLIFIGLCNMVFVLELDEDSPDSHRHFHDRHFAPHPSIQDFPSQVNETGQDTEKQNDRENPNINGFTALLCCYP